MDFPVIMLLFAFVAIVAIALIMLSRVGPVPLDSEQPSNFQSRLSQSRLQKGAVLATAAGAGVVGASLATAEDPRKKKDDGGSTCGGDVALMTSGADSGGSGGGDSDGGSSCGGGGCGD